MHVDSYAENGAHTSENVATAELPVCEPCGWRWPLLVVAALFLAAALGALYALLAAPPRYQAAALVMIEDSTPFVAFTRASDQRQEARYVRTQIELLRSPMVLERVLERKEVGSVPELQNAEDPMAVLRDTLKIAQVAHSELYEISFLSQSAQGAADLVNAIVSEYMQIQSDEEYRRSERVIAILDDERNARSIEVERLRQRVLEVSREATAQDPFGSGFELDTAAANDRIGDVYRRLDEVKMKHELVRAEIQLLKNRLPDAAATPAGAGVDAEAIATDSAEIRAWRAAQAEMRALLAEIKTGDAAWSDNPNFVRLADKLQNQQVTLDALAQARPAAGPAAQPEQDGSADRIASLEIQLKLLEVERDLLQRRCDALSKPEASSSKWGELAFAKSELAREEKVFEMIAARKLALQTELRAPARVGLRQKASVPKDSDQSMYRPLVLMFAVVAASAISVGLFVKSRGTK